MDKSPKILIADDDANTLFAYSRLLESEGYEVFTVASGQECLRVARAERPEVILLDVMLPDLSGIEVCRQIKADPDLSNIFVFHISGIETSPDSQVEGLKSGADLYMTKPIEYPRLLAQIQALLRIKGDVNAALMEQQRRELESLERLAGAQGTPVAAQMFGALPLRQAAPDIFEHLVQLYSNLLDLALQQRTYKIEHNIAEQLHGMVDQLGLLRAGPRDIVDIHRLTMKRKALETNLLKAQAYVEEGRMRLIELMGHMVSYYRTRSLGSDRPPAQEETHE